MPNSSAQRDVEKQYVQRWQRLSPLLDAIRHEELRHMTEEEHYRAIEQLWSVDVEFEPRTTSGLVEWQKLLRR